MAKFIGGFVVFSVAVSAATGFLGAHAQEPTGALYPTDVVPNPYAEVSAKADYEGELIYPGDATAEDPELAKALGPASFVLTHSGGMASFSSQVRRAIGKHPDFHSQMSGLAGILAEKKLAKSSLYPELSTSLSGDFVIDRDFAANTNNVFESQRPSERLTASISASQLIFDGGATFQRIRGARARHEEFKNSVSAKVNEIALASLAAYHDLLTHQALGALGGDFVRRHEQILDDVKERERLGASSKADVTNAVARLAVARARVAQIIQSTQMAEIRFGEFFDEAPSNLRRPSFNTRAIDSKDKAIEAALAQSPEIAVMAARADASRAEYKAAKSARLPEVRASVDAVKYDVFDSGDDFDIRAGVNLNYNIFGGGARAANISQAASHAHHAKIAEGNMRREIEREAAIAFVMREGAAARLGALRAAVIAHDQTRKLVLERYRASRGDLIDVLQAENDYFEAGVAYLTALANADMAHYALMEHTGDLLRNFSPQEEYAREADGGMHEGMHE